MPRQEIEESEEDVGEEQLTQQIPTKGCHLLRRRDRQPRGLDHAEKNRGQHHIDRRPGQGDQQFLLGIIGHPFEPSHAADG